MSKNDEVKNLKAQQLLLGKEIDELKRQYNRFVQTINNSNELNTLKKELGSVKNAMFEITESIDSIDQVLIDKGIYSSQEVKDKLIQSFLDRRNYTKDVKKEALESGDLTFIKFVCVDENKQVVFAEPHPVKYQIGIGALPFESKIVSCKPGATEEFEVDFPDNFFNKNAAGKKLNVVLTCQLWATPDPSKKKTPQKNPPAISPHDKPKTMNDDGELET